jgi:hypothetical protein
MEIRIRETGAVMYESEFRAYAQTQGAVFGEPLTEEFINQYGGDIVLEGPQATGNHYQYSQRSGVEQINGKWYTKYILGPVFTDTPATDTEPAKTAAEQEAAYHAAKDAEQAKSVRETRTTKLAESDWTQLTDAPVNSALWATYRQALRNVPTQTGFPWDITWPDAP